MTSNSWPTPTYWLTTNQITFSTKTSFYTTFSIPARYTRFAAVDDSRRSRAPFSRTCDPKGPRAYRWDTWPIKIFHPLRPDNTFTFPCAVVHRGFPKWFFHDTTIMASLYIFYYITLLSLYIPHISNLYIELWKYLDIHRGKFVRMN